ncbi:hypothetical protein IW148_001977 [Coemansia sp. RSA 1199]|nr:hypothetical protein IW148_001977 [Coemansia sp. RSA 1199]
MTRSQLRRVAIAFALVLGAANVYFYNYAAFLALSHPDSDIRFNLYGDPQIEGDAKIAREPTTGKYDLLVNDYYLKHIYASTIAAFQPKYVVTMGDMFSSQRANKEEYYKRIDRFKWISHQVDTNMAPLSGSHTYLYLAGNHDIGYGGETRAYQVNRYTNNFGPLNHDWMVDLHSAGQSSNGLHQFAIINAMHLDKTRDEQFRNATWQFVQQLATQRAQHPEIPLALFLHIPLNKPAGICTMHPKTNYTDGFIKYQDYLSPATSAYILHCLAPTLVFNGHDHDGCLSAHKIRRAAPHPVVLGDSGNTLQISDDLCRMNFTEIDTYQAEVEAFGEATLSAVAGSDFTSTAGNMVVEVTVRSAMGAYGGVTGVFDISRDNTSAGTHMRALGRGFTLRSEHGYRYQYREVRLGDHLIIRILLVASILGAFVVPAALLF